MTNRRVPPVPVSGKSSTTAPRRSTQGGASSSAGDRPPPPEPRTQPATRSGTAAARPSAWTRPTRTPSATRRTPRGDNAEKPAASADTPTVDETPNVEEVDAEITVEEPIDEPGEVPAAASTHAQAGDARAAAPAGQTSVPTTVNMPINLPQAPSTSSGTIVVGECTAPSRGSSRLSLPSTPGERAQRPARADHSTPDARAAARRAARAAATAETEGPVETRPAAMDEDEIRPARGAVVSRSGRGRLASEVDGEADRTTTRPRTNPERRQDVVIGRPDSRREGLPPSFRGWGAHRRVEIRWPEAATLAEFVGAVRRVALATREAPQSPTSEAIQNEFLAQNEGGFQIPQHILGDRLTVPDADEAQYVRSMNRWLRIDRPHEHPPIVDPSTWFVRDLASLRSTSGTQEHSDFRRLRLEYTLTRVAGRYIPYEDYVNLREERSRDPGFLEHLHAAANVDALLRVDLSEFCLLPERIRAVLPAPGLAVPRLRALYYFGDVLRSPSAYNLHDDVRRRFVLNLGYAASFEWAHCLAVALESDFRATGRVIQQPSSVPAFIHRFLLGLQVPAIRMGTEDEAQPPIDVRALVDRLERAAALSEDFLYFRVDRPTGIQVRWAYEVDGQFVEAGLRHGRYGGECVQRSRWPSGDDHNPRPRPGEPGYRPLGDESLRLRVNGRELQEHMPQAYRHVSRVFRGSHLMPVRNVVEHMSSHLRWYEGQMQEWRRSYEEDQAEFHRLHASLDEARRGRESDNRWHQGEEARLRSERNSVRAEAAQLRDEVNRQATTIQSFANPGRVGFAGAPAMPAPGAYGGPVQYLPSHPNTPQYAPAPAPVVPTMPANFVPPTAAYGAPGPSTHPGYTAAPPASSGYGAAPSGYQHSPTATPYNASAPRATIAQQPPATQAPAQPPASQLPSTQPASASYHSGYSYRNPYP